MIIHSMAIAAVVLVLQLLHYYFYVLYASVIMSWLYAFGVVSPYNRIARVVDSITGSLVDPVLRKLKNVLPFLVVGTVDFSVVALFFILQFVEMGIYSLLQS